MFVEILYATLEKQNLIKVKVTSNDTIESVINASNVLNIYPEIDLNINRVGIFNQVKSLNEIVKSGDRVEIYRPLIANPKDARRSRAIKQREQGIVK